MIPACLPGFVSYGSLLGLRGWQPCASCTLIAVAGTGTVAAQHRCGFSGSSSARQATCRATRLSSEDTVALSAQLFSSSRRSRPPRARRQRRVSVLIHAVGTPPQPSTGDDGGAGGDTNSGSLQDGQVGPESLASDSGMPPPPPPSRPPFRQRTRLTEALLSGPSRVDDYFDSSPWRRLLWLAIAFAAGFYCANTVSLSFGTLAVNDVVAAAVTLAFCEAISYMYYQAPTVGLPLALANSFKMGVTAALISDALKLQA